MKKDKITEILKHSDLFRPVPEEVLHSLIEESHTQLFQPGEVMIRKGEEGDFLFLIISGAVKVHDEGQTVAEFKQGEIVGELALLDQGPRSMTVTSTVKTECLVINRESFFRILKDRPDTTEKMIGILTQRLRNQNLRLVDHLMQREEELSRLVKERTEDLHQRNIELKETVDKLKATQQQLILSEKMASLVQLTAGIAHEIQNPLNFVINFSAVTHELLKELREAKTEEERTELLNDLDTNIDKIRQHGKRADATIKSMLQHSRSGTGEKQLTDLSELIDEILRLSYQGARAVNNEFNCHVEFRRDDTLPKVSIVPQDFSRVLLNMFNNAFYSLHEKKEERVKAGDVNYEPRLTIETQLHQGFVDIHVIDNGLGIPPEILQKIFNPFFTTKPPGQGTGLGLSLSYDIITKTHNGKLKVHSKVGEGTEFIISVPL